MKRQRRVLTVIDDGDVEEECEIIGFVMVEATAGRLGAKWGAIRNESQSRGRMRKGEATAALRLRWPWRLLFLSNISEERCFILHVGCTSLMLLGHTHTRYIPSYLLRLRSRDEFAAVSMIMKPFSTAIRGLKAPSFIKLLLCNGQTCSHQFC